MASVLILSPVSAPSENAEAYKRGTYPEAFQILARVIEGTPKVKTYEVSNSTFHKIAATATA